MAHHHHNHSHGADAAGQKNIYLLCIVLNLAFVAVETGIGLWSGSLGLVSDAGHNLSDVFSLILALVAVKLALTRGRSRYTYGYRKASVLISLLNAVILLVAVGVICVESIQKFSNPVAVDGGAIAWTAGIGILINGFTTILLMRNQKHDINARGAFLHMAADTLVSVGVVISGLVIKFTGWVIVDPVISLVIAAVILISTWSLLSESIRMSIDAVPEGIDMGSVEAAIRGTEGVEGVHHIHVWPISTTETALTAHLVVAEYASGQTVVPAVKAALAAAGIQHATLEVETPQMPCEGGDC